MGGELEGARVLTAFLIDTSFLISFADPTRPHHAAATAYFREALQCDVPLYFSAIAASEFQVKQAVTDLPLRNFIVLPFNFDHAMTAGLLMRQLNRETGDRRDVVKDDVKLIAQAVCESVSHVLTEDRQTLAKYVQRFNDTGQSALRTILWLTASTRHGSTVDKRAFPVPDAHRFSAGMASKRQ